jgi:hypothetical protein
MVHRVLGWLGYLFGERGLTLQEVAFLLDGLAGELLCRLGQRRRPALRQLILGLPPPHRMHHTLKPNSAIMQSSSLEIQEMQEIQGVTRNCPMLPEMYCKTELRNVSLAK